ncbi:unnamed protein product, partial [marine sediment metagenome]
TASIGGDLEADSGESFLVKAIFNALPATKTDTYLTAKIDNVTVGYYRCVGKSGNHLGGASASTFARNLMQFLVSLGLPFSLPIAEGQKLNISRAAGTGKLIILYDRYDAGDIRADMPCGTAAKNYGFLQYLRESAVLAASGNMLLDTAITPAEFPDFPAGKTVPAKMRIKLHGIAGCPVADFASGDNGFYTSYLKLVREREVLFDEDRDGFLFWGNDQTAQAAQYILGKSLIGSGAVYAEFNSFWMNQSPLMFDPPLVFESG